MSRQFQTAVAAMALAVTLAAPLAAHAADALRIVKDPATGELRGPTAAEAAAFEKAEAALRAGSGKQAAKQPVEIRYPDGTIETKMGEDTMMYSVVREDASGALTFACLPAKEAQKFVKAKKSSTAKTAAKVGHEHQ